MTAHAETLKKATFAGGCFWCMESPYDALDGVISTISGYANGTTKEPTYQEVSHGDTKHVEVIQITYDADKVSYETLLEVYWANSDPLDGGGQFCDRGDSYRPAIMYHDDAQKILAEKSRELLEQAYDLEGKIETSIEKLDAYYPAEDYHQNYYSVNPVRYKFYRASCGRDGRLKTLWNDAKKLTLF